MMSKGLALDFESGGVRINLERERQGAELELQKAIINIMTWSSSDVLFSTRGTLLQRAALSGSLFSLNAARHASNFAAADTASFLANDQNTLIDKLVLEPVQYEDRRLRLNLRGYVGETEIKLKVLL
jgi:hypothetical protein